MSPYVGAGDPDSMISLARGLVVIRAFSLHRQRRSIARVSQRTGISRAGVGRTVVLERARIMSIYPGVGRRCLRSVPRPDAGVTKHSRGGRRIAHRGPRVTVPNDRTDCRLRDSVRRLLMPMGMPYRLIPLSYLMHMAYTSLGFRTSGCPLDAPIRMQTRIPTSLAALLLAVTGTCLFGCAAPLETSRIPARADGLPSPLARVRPTEPIQTQPRPPIAAESATSEFPSGALYTCVSERNGQRQNTNIAFAPKLAALCARHPEMGPCQYERDVCRRSGGRVFAANGREVTRQIEDEYDRKVLRVRFRAN